MDTEHKKRGYLLADFRLFHLKDQEGTPIDYHYHEFCKLLLLKSGCGGYTVDGQRYSLKSGDIVLIDSHCVHRPEFEAGTLYERVILYISPSFLHRHAAPDCCLTDIFNGTKGHVLHLKQPDAIWAIADALEEELEKEDYGRTILCSGLLLRLIIEIARIMRDPKTPFPTPIIPTDSRIVEMIRYMDAHLTENLTIDLLSEVTFLSKFHMMRLFKQETGRSIYDYLQERRLLFARDLIRQGISATDSCYQSGFHSYSSFTRAYAKHFGTTPTGKKGTPTEETFE